MKGKKIQSIGGLGSIVVIFLVVFLTNQDRISSLKIKDTESIHESVRGLASAQIQETNDFSSQWKKNIAVQIAETSEIPWGKVSRKPSPLEQLVFGDLKGLYLLQMEGVKIKEMRLDHQREVDELPRYLGEEYSFLNSNKALWWLDYNSLVVKERKDNESIVSLLDASNRIIGEAHFSWDVAGRMVSLKIEKK